MSSVSMETHTRASTPHTIEPQEAECVSCLSYILHSGLGCCLEPANPVTGVELVLIRAHKQVHSFNQERSEYRKAKVEKKVLLKLLDSRDILMEVLCSHCSG
jgi:hypothetical protein